MVPKNNNLDLSVKGFLGSILVAIGIILIYSLISAVRGESSIVSLWGMILVWISIVLIMLSGILYLVALILSLLEIIRSKKSLLWKVLWAIVCLIQGIGVPAYYFLGRKSL